MTVNATSLLGLALPVTGTESGTWGDTVNNSLTDLLDTAVAGTTTLSSDGDVTLSTTTLAANQARQAILLWTATGSTTRNITAPAQSKPYIVINATGGSQSIVLRGAGPTTGITIAPAEKVVAAWNGSDFVKVGSTLPISTVPISSGGTGQTTATAAFDALAPTTTQGDISYYNGTDNVRLGIGTAGQALIVNSGATAPQWGSAGVSTGKSIAMAMIFGF